MVSVPCAILGVFLYLRRMSLLADALAHVALPGIVVAVPFMVGVYLVGNAYAALTLSIVPGLLSNVYLGNTIATTHGLVGLRMRATASAILFLILNIIGLGFGPFLVGVLSDLLSGPFGADSLRYAILIATVAYFWAGAHFLLASRTIRRDLEAAQAAEA